MAVLKVIEIMAASDKGWKDAAKKAVEEAAKSVNNIKSVWIKDQDGVVKGGKIVEYRVIVKVTFAVGD